MNIHWRKILTIIKMIFFTIILVVIGIISSYVFDFDGRKYYKVDSTWITDTGVLSQLDRGKNTSSKFMYEYQGKIYNEYSHYSYGSKILGEKCIVKINPKYPNKYVPIEWKPLFTNDEIINTTKGRVIRFRRSLAIDFLNPSYKSNKNVVFEYYINGEKYEAEQSLDPDYKNIYPSIREGAVFEVKYLSENPKRVIIYFDNLING